MADKRHLHHRLLNLGFTHRGAVLTIYAIAVLFSFTALLLNYTSRVGTIVLIIAMVFALTFLLELIGLIPEKYGIITKSFRFFGNKELPFIGIAQIFQEMSVDVPYESK